MHRQDHGYIFYPAWSEGHADGCGFERLLDGLVKGNAFQVWHRVDLELDGVCGALGVEARVQIDVVVKFWRAELGRPVEGDGAQEARLGCQ